MQLLDPRTLSLLQNQFIEALDLHIKNTRERHLQVLCNIMVVIAQIRKVDRLKDTQYLPQGGAPYGDYCDRYQRPQGVRPQMPANNINSQVVPVTSYPTSSQWAPPVNQMQSQMPLHSQPYSYMPDANDMRYICLWHLFNTLHQYFMTWHHFAKTFFTLHN